MIARAYVLVALTTALVVLAGCGAQHDATPPVQKPASAAAPPAAGAPAPPPPPSGPKVPATQQDAQDNVTHYLQQTLDALPKGATLDGTRYALDPSTVPCDGPNATIRVQDSRDVDLPPDTDPARVVTSASDFFGAQQGWTVDTGDDQGKPSRVAHTPDGYTVRVDTTGDAGQRPTLVGLSPCFPAGLREDDVPRTPVLEQSQ
jgi:hypothetical protein